jgi:hypothetical protein
MKRALPWLLLVSSAIIAICLWFALIPFGEERSGSEPPPAPSLPERDRTRRAASHREVASGDERPADPARTPDEPPAAPPPPVENTNGLAVDPDGNFRPDAATVELFEASLSSGQASRGVAAIRAEITAKLDPPAETQALDLLDRYMDYRERGIALGLNQDVEADFRPRFAQLRSLRREFFGVEDALRMFGEEERQANVALREYEIDSDPNLTDEERATLFGELYNPPPERNE